MVKVIKAYHFLAREECKENKDVTEERHGYQQENLPSQQNYNIRRFHP
jgi:hypothetical protein